MPCTRRSCCYHTAGNSPNGCNYIFVTGTSKLSQMPPNVTYSIDDCPFYKSGNKRSATKGSQIASANSIEIVRQAATLKEKDVEELYDLDLCDADIAIILNVFPEAIAKYRRQKGLIRSMSKCGGIRRINWDEVDAMIREGYSDIAVAMFISVPLEVIQKYKFMLEKKKSGGGKDESNQIPEAFNGEGD